MPYPATDAVSKRKEAGENRTCDFHSLFFSMQKIPLTAANIYKRTIKKDSLHHKDEESLVRLKY